ncbi:hypothetical protein Golax_021322, partial [Gossypium laxum]|nr:hypothetical protein [Gossypium laxum]
MVFVRFIGGLFFRTLLDREESMLSKLKVLVGSLELDLEVEDRIIWIHDSAGEFTIKKLSDLLTYDGMGANDFPYIRIWKLKVQSRVRNFLWMMAIKRLPTKDFLISWGVHLDTSICSCPWCDREMERLQKSLWLIAISASCWIVWLARNNKIFNRTSTNLDTMLYHSKMRSLMWARAVHEDCQFSNGYWWCWPKPPPPGWMKFNVVGVALEDEVGCGGILRDDKGVACALFLGRIEAKRLEMAEIMAIKTTMHMYIGST